MSWQTKKNRLSIKKTLNYLKVKSDINPGLRVFFFDEARFGLQTSLSRIWALAGKPLQIKVKQAYQNFYVYGAVEPKTGENFSLFLPWVNTEMMSLYLEQMSLAHANEELVLIMDQAGWHKSKELVVPDNIEIIYLPPYSPELNPIERLWKYMKTNFIHNRVFDSLKDLMAQMMDVFDTINEHTIATLCQCSYLDL